MGARGRTCPQLTRSDTAELSPAAMIRLLWGDVANLKEIADEQIQDSKHAMAQVGVILRQNESEMICSESELYLGFQTP